jgi:hypothetical protein
VRALAICAVVLLTVIAGPVFAGEIVPVAPIAASTAGCTPAQECGHSAGPLAGWPSQPQAPQSCVQHTACGGGAALALGAMVLVAVLVGSNDLGGGATSRRTIRLPVASFVNRLAAGRLFRPPRLSF